jgi:hypothetical protein
MEKKKTSNKPETAVKKSQSKLNLGKVILKLGTLPAKERNKVLKVWSKAHDIHMNQDVVNGPFNPTSMDEKTFRNFICYLQLTVIDKHFGIQKDFVPTQNYKQELDREFRNRDLSLDAKLDPKLEKLERIKISKREKDIMGIGQFFEHMYGWDSINKYPIVKSKKSYPAKVKRIW